MVAGGLPDVEAVPSGADAAEGKRRSSGVATRWRSISG